MYINHNNDNSVNILYTHIVKNQLIDGTCVNLKLDLVNTDFVLKKLTY
jgi:hypothetical protein